jgi:hypothetical protein
VSDFIVAYNPDVPNSTTWLDRQAYRDVWYAKGWRSNDDPYASGRYMQPGTQVDYADLTTSFGNVTAASGSFAAAEFGAAARLTLPLLDQPVLLEAWFILASITSASAFTVAWSPLASVTSTIAMKGARQYTAVPVATLPAGTHAYIRYQVPAGTPAGDWTIAGSRDSGTGAGTILANGIYSGGALATAR